MTMQFNVTTKVNSQAIRRETHNSDDTKAVQAAIDYLSSLPLPHEGVMRYLHFPA